MGPIFWLSEDDESPGERGGVEMRAMHALSADVLDVGLAPRVVTTGGKNAQGTTDQAPKGNQGIDLETGEPVDMYMHATGVQFVRHLIPDPTAAAHLAQVDALAFTVVPPGDQEPWRWVVDQMQTHLPIENLEQGKGCFGFSESLKFGKGAGLIAWGGNSQRGRAYFSIQGKGCSIVHDWPALAQWLSTHNAKIKRVDLAHDDFDGATVNIAWARSQYAGDGFNAGGRRPKHGLFGDWLSGEASAHGRTLGIGNRKSGKYCRIYEKGKQLGDPFSPWTRVEVEWRGKDRIIPLSILTRPGSYLAGAYPCLAFLNAEQSRIRTVANAAEISYDSAVEYLRQQFGKLVNLMVTVNQGDLGRVVELVRRDGIPERIRPYSYQLAKAICASGRQGPTEDPSN